MAACDTIPTSEFEADPIKQGMPIAFMDQFP